MLAGLLLDVYHKLLASMASTAKGACARLPGPRPQLRGPLLAALQL